MLTKLIAALALCLALTITPLTASPAYAEGGCEGASWGVACGVGVPGYGGSGGAAPLKHTGSGSSDPVACVTQEMPPREVPCSNPELGTWSNARACYVKAESPPPPLTDAVWSGNTTGSIYRCSASGIWSGPGSYLFWADSAPGVSDEQLARLCERFYRAEGSRNRASGGSGLGLAICLNIVAAHGGTLRADHSPFGGVSIKVELPLEHDLPRDV